MQKKSIIFACRLIERHIPNTKMLLQKNKQLNLTILIPPDTPMASIQNIKRPYITPAIEECFDCESEDWLMGQSRVDVIVSGTDSDDKSDGDIEFPEDESKTYWFNIDDNDNDY